MSVPTSATPITIMTVDDHQLLRAGLSEAIGSQPDMRLVAEAVNGLEAIEKFHATRPDVTLMDIAMPEMGGVDALIAIRNNFPSARIMMLTTYSGDVRIRSAIRAGAAGFLLKSTLRRDLFDSIRMVHGGQRRIPMDVAMELAQFPVENTLSPREIEVLKLAAVGQSNKRICALLEISEDTVKAHMKSIMAKLEANDRTHAVTIALQRGIIIL
ncbi:DNA-binding response regulator [Undibacterium terreum]|uniref:DNA-binding response regulator n=2 Tax=Undibacterium terreum TaxID=1224302 RepID=A0A916UL19_9BURK|nr:DNA-binding response regulator [Undibacterium terreum]